VDSGSLGKEYSDGEVIIQEGNEGNRMFFIRSGRVKVTRMLEGREIPIGTLETGDIFGEMAIFDREVRSATVRADGKAVVLSIDKAGFLRRMHEDPSLVFRVLQQMSRRIRKLDAELAEARAGGMGAEGARRSD